MKLQILFQITNTKIINLNYVVFNVAKVATAKHRIRAIRRIIADATLTRIQFVVDDANFKARWLVSESNIEDSGLEGRHEIDEDKYPLNDW